MLEEELCSSVGMLVVREAVGVKVAQRFRVCVRTASGSDRIIELG